MSDSHEITEAANSCEIIQNAKGERSFKVKAYAATLEEAVEKSQEMAEKMTTWANK
jgi:hypothetical protein